MRPAAKWTIAFLSALVLAAPLSFGIWIWNDFHGAGLRKQREAADIIARFHQRLNSGDFDAICRYAYRCSEFPNLRQDWQAALEATRERGGAFRSVIRSDIKVTIEPSSVHADVVSLFEKAQLHETFEMKEYDGPLRIIKYQEVAE
jgi:hypothetical protein